jgi:hypothetical protein|eukprot:COSAG06_NODE_23658_length_685_cov_0.986348_2_plen_79_part_00
MLTKITFLFLQDYHGQQHGCECMNTNATDVLTESCNCILMLCKPPAASSPLLRAGSCYTRIQSFSCIIAPPLDSLLTI